MSIEEMPGSLPWHVIETNKCYPTIMSKEGMVGSALTREDAEFIVNACNRYAREMKRVKE